MALSHIEWRHCSFFILRFKASHRRANHVCYHSQEGPNRRAFNYHRFASHAGHFVVKRTCCFIRREHVVGFQGGVNAGPLGAVQDHLSSFRGQEYYQFRNCGVGFQVVLLRYANCATGHSSHAGSHRGDHSFTIHVFPCFLTYHPFIGNNVNQVLRLLWGRQAKGAIARFLHFDSEHYRTSRSIHRCSLYARYLRRVPPFRTRHFKRDRCRVVAFCDERRYRPSANVSAYKFSGHHAKFRGSTDFNIFGRQGDRPILRAPYQVRYFRLNSGVLFRAVFPTVAKGFR